MELLIDASAIGLDVTPLEVSEDITLSALTSTLGTHLGVAEGTYLISYRGSVLEEEHLRVLSLGDVLEVCADVGVVAREVLRGVHGVGDSARGKIVCQRVWSVVGGDTAAPATTSTATEVTPEVLALCFEAGYLGPRPYATLFLSQRRSCHCANINDGSSAKVLDICLTAGLTGYLFPDLLPSLLRHASCPCSANNEAACLALIHTAIEASDVTTTPSIPIASCHTSSTGTSTTSTSTMTTTTHIEDVPLYICSAFEPHTTSAKIACLLLDHGAVPNVFGENRFHRGFTSLVHNATAYGNMALLETLRARCGDVFDIDVSSTEATSVGTALHCALKHSQADVARSLVALGASISMGKCSPLMAAIPLLDAELLKAMLATAHEVDVHAGGSLLELGRCVSAGVERLERVEVCLGVLLEDMGEDVRGVDVCDASGRTALMHVVTAGRGGAGFVQRAVAALLEAGASAKAVAADGNTALIALLASADGSSADSLRCTAQMLIAAGARTDAVRATTTGAATFSLSARTLLIRKGFGDLV